MNDVQRFRKGHIIGIITTFVVVELALYELARRAPAFRALIRPGYVVAALVALYSLWHVTRPRRRDRREGERRNSV